MDVVSVIVTTKNEAANIGACLASIAAQDYPREALDIVVVDNGSTDDTKAIARTFTDRVFDKGPERSAQRNFGMLEAARGRYVMFLDADMILSKGVVRRSVELLSSGRYAALHIPEIVLGQGFFPHVRRFERSFYDGTVIDGARILEKDTFARVGGFDLDLTGPEDWDLDKKIKRIGPSGSSRATTSRSWTPTSWPCPRPASWTPSSTSKNARTFIRPFFFTTRPPSTSSAT